jgi:hypothetical protein
LKLGPNQTGRAAELFPAAFDPHEVGIRPAGGRILIQQLLQIRISRGPIGFVAHEGVQNRIPRHPAEPGAEPGPFGIVRPPLDGPGDRQQHLLRHIVGIGRLHPLVPRQPVNDRPVNLDKLLPRLAVGRIPNAQQQTGTSFQRLSHEGTFLYEYTQPPARSDTPHWHRAASCFGRVSPRLL